MVSGFSKIEIRYDYEGIEKWVTGAWRSRTELTQKYAHSMRRWGENITICFTKVAAHSNVYYNEMADRTAKAGLREGRRHPDSVQGRGTVIWKIARGRLRQGGGCMRPEPLSRPADAAFV